MGGWIGDELFLQLNKLGRVSVCGLISEYNLDKPYSGLNLRSIVLTKQLSVQGFIITSHMHKVKEMSDRLMALFTASKLQLPTKVYKGKDKVIEAFLGLFKGSNIGKTLVEYS